MKTIGNLTHSKTSFFQSAKFLNEAGFAYEILDTQLGPGGWYPENQDCAWTDIVVFDEKYYAAYGEDSVTCSDAKLIYIQIAPSTTIRKEYEYLKQY